MPTLSRIVTRSLRLPKVILFVSMCALASGWSSVYAATVTHPVAVDSYEVEVDQNGYDVIRIEGFNLRDDPGNPRLPRHALTILLPPNADLSTLSLSSKILVMEKPRRTFNVGPAMPFAAWVEGKQLLDWGVGKEIVNGRNMIVYGESKGFPENHVRLVTYSQMRKYKLARVEFSPFRYNPVSGEATLAREVALEISFDELPDIDRRLLQDDVCADLIPGLVANQERIDEWYGESKGRTSTYDYVIITTNAIVAGSQQLDDFIAQKEMGGHTVLVVTEDDFGSLTGQAPNNRAEKIRQWLIDNYVSLGITYVLLIGEPHPYESGEGDIPMKMCWPRYNSPEYRESPTDYFYADLTGNWDLDGDEYYGEWEDTGEGGVDYVPEVFVGRIPVYYGSYIALDAILQKIMDYEMAQGPVAWRRNVLLPTSFLDAGTDYAALAEQVKDDYLDPLEYSSWRMYQQGSGACGVNSAYTSEEELRGGTVVRDRWISDDFGVVLWAGHGGIDAVWAGYDGCWDGIFFDNADCDFIDNSRPAFTYQGSCDNGWPESAGNLGYSLLAQGAIATVSASRVSWYYCGQSYGDFDGSTTIGGIGYEYVSRLIQEMDCGHALYLAKASMTPASESRLMNYCDYNLYGDPSISLASTGPSPWVDATSGPLGDASDGTGVAWGDYDNDADLDLYLANFGSPNRLFRNDGEGFTLVSGDHEDSANGVGVTWGDYDNDGDLDLYLANYNGTNRLFRNDASDLVAVSGEHEDSGPSEAAAWGDYDNDGDIDLYVTNFGSANRLFRNDNTVFHGVPGDHEDTGHGFGTAWGDYDNDGDLDLYLANHGDPNRLFRNDGGGFVRITGAHEDAGSGMGIAWGDYDNDGDLDIYVGNDGINRLFRNDSGAFVDVTVAPLDCSGVSRGVAWGDYDRDGQLDLYIANSGANNLLCNDGAGGFIDVTEDPLTNSANGQGVAWGDYDNDGDLDLYLANMGAGNCLFENDFFSGGNWLKVDLVGLISNASGIGARVRVVTGGLCQIREISGGSGYCSQNSITADFGIGSTTIVDSVEICWPSGIVQRLSNVSANTTVQVEEAVPEWADATSGPMGDTGNGCGVAWGDYDGDEDPDLYVANSGGANKLFRNEGGGVFTDVTGGPLGDAGDGRGVAWGDQDNDGDLDLYLVNYGGSNKLFRNEGGGVFTDVTGGLLGDAGDGRGVAWGDYDNDGDLDIYLVNNGANKLLRNDGGEVFVDQTVGPLGDSGDGWGAAWGDCDNDGDIDLYVANSGGANVLLLNDEGVFTDATAGPLGDAGEGKGVAWGDYDNDGDLDLYLVNDGGNCLFRNDGGAVFADVTTGILDDTGNGRSVAWLDYNNDCVLDLYIVNHGSGNKLLQNKGGGRFIDVTYGPLGDVGNGNGLAAGDYDGDGDLDLYLANESGSNRLLQNDLASGAHWLHVDLAGIVSNRLGVGARILAICGDVSQIREISGGSGYASQNSLTAEFGLGSATQVDTLEIRWPSGIVQRLARISVDTRLTVEEVIPLWADATSGPLGDTGNSRGTAWGDYDDDGDLDLYVANNGANKLLRNDETTFVDVTAGPLGDTGNGMGVAWGDYDNDRDLDLYLSNYGDANKLFRNDDGAFADVTGGPLGDTGSGRNVAWVDYDNDGDLDLYVLNDGSNKLLRNEGAGGFADVTSDPLGDTGNGWGMAWGDYDNDGDSDVYLSNAGSANRLVRNDGGEVFTDVTSGPLGDTGNGMGVAWGDYDNDGDLDLYLGKSGSSDRLYRNDGSDTFADVTAGPLANMASTRGVGWGDYDNDGDLDLYIGNMGSANKLLKNTGGGVFEDATDEVLDDAGYAAGVAWGDYDDDGDLDLYLANDGNANKLFRKVFSVNRWLHLDLEGTESNVSAIGARVRIVTAGVSQIREVSGGSGFCSQNSLRVEFGLGSASTVDTVEIRWPSGIVQHEHDLAANQVIVIVETDISGTKHPRPTPQAYRLYPNCPNPFRPATSIHYDLPKASHTSLRVYDVNGRLIQVLVDLPSQEPGRHAVTWDGRNLNGNMVASGVYFYRLEAGRFTKTRRMVLLR